MAIDWKPKAVDAAIRGWFDTDATFRKRMRSALDSAVQAQGLTTEIERLTRERDEARVASGLRDAASEIRRLRDALGVEKDLHRITVGERDAAERKVEKLREALKEAGKWIEADEGFATDFPEEWERLTKLINAALAETEKQG